VEKGLNEGGETKTRAELFAQRGHNKQHLNNMSTSIMLNTTKVPLGTKSAMERTI
jgi:hypothetical protein